ncbi:hypothetical protein BKA64DRAFT_753855 [Cadophora sp. MPI-SDFR-AT-0126]|nr:hypothetical protein BKA64DRAFT_753855 [Leotiomycetes sp. MPI-SDFR-AT-0126]
MARPHAKTRTGCVQCKQRKIKCDEAKPSCRNCNRHRSTCSFLQYVPLGRGLQHGRLPSREPSHHRPYIPPQTQDQDQQQQQQSNNLNAHSKSTRNTNHNLRVHLPASRPGPRPSPALNSLPTTFTGPDLHLLHSYTTQTSQSMLGPHMTGSSIWGTSIVSLSFTHSFLIHAMFSLSALHLVHLHSSSPDQFLSQRFQQIATYHHTKALTLFRHELQNLNEENAAACAACSSFLSLIPWIVPGAKGENIFFPSALPPSAPSSPSPHLNPSSSTTPSPVPPQDENRTIVPWYKLHRGGHQIVTLTYTWIARSSNSELVDIVSPWKADQVPGIMKIHLSPPAKAESPVIPNGSVPVPLSIPHHPSPFQTQIQELRGDESSFARDWTDGKQKQKPLTDDERLTHLASCWSSPNPNTPHPTLSQTDIIALDETLSTLRYVFSIVSPPPTSKPSPHSPPPTHSVSPTIAALSWPTMITAHFCSMLEARVPETLVLVAVYCIALKRTGDGGGLWWIRGKGESLLGAVGREMRLLDGRRGDEGGRRSWERGGWEEWIREEMGADFW